jgi:hypothetical protein
MRTIALIVGVLIFSGVALADEWECSIDGDSKCYVTHVRFVPNGANPFVEAKLHDPSFATSCDLVRFQMNEGVTSLESLRGVEAVLLTALTTGLPIRFYRLTDFGSNEECSASTIIISKKGH